jgi:hypothetical protein
MSTLGAEDNLNPCGGILKGGALGMVGARKGPTRQPPQAGRRKMKLQEVYEKYKHLDIVLSDPIGESFEWTLIRDLWMAIKEHMEGPNE